eukprot:3313018-Pleurochrysis_carterae.AAC.1
MRAALRRGYRVHQPFQLEAILREHLLRLCSRDESDRHLHDKRGAAGRVWPVAHPAAQDGRQLLRVVEAEAGALHRSGICRGRRERQEERWHKLRRHAAAGVAHLRISRGTTSPTRWSTWICKICCTYLEGLHSCYTPKMELCLKWVYRNRITNETLHGIVPSPPVAGAKCPPVWR